MAEHDVPDDVMLVLFLYLYLGQACVLFVLNQRLTPSVEDARNVVEMTSGTNSHAHGSLLKLDVQTTLAQVIVKRTY